LRCQAKMIGPRFPPSQPSQPSRCDGCDGRDGCDGLIGLGGDQSQAPACGLSFARRRSAVLTPGVLELCELVTTALLCSRWPDLYGANADLGQQPSLLVHCERMGVFGSAGTAISGPPRIG